MASELTGWTLNVTTEDQIQQNHQRNFVVEKPVQSIQKASSQDSKKNESGCFQIGCGASLLLLLIFYVIGSLAPEYDASKEEFDEATIKVYCVKQVKDQLVDPDSYVFESAQVLATTGAYKQYGLGVLYFRSKNSFGGYVRGTAECKKFDQEGDGGAWIKATIQ